MANNIINLETYRGDDFRLNLRFKDRNGPIDITGWTIYMTIKSKTTDPDVEALLEKDVTTHIDPTHGETAIVLTNTDVYNLIGILQYDVQFKTNTGLVKTCMRGTIKFDDDVTRRV